MNCLTSYENDYKVLTDLVCHLDDKTWLQIYDIFEKDSMPKEIHEVARKLKLDVNFTTEEEEEANHTMLLCGFTDCKYCIEKNKKDL